MKNESVREIGVGVGRTEAAGGGVAEYGRAGGSGAVEDRSADVVGSDVPVGRVARAGVADDDVARGIDLDALIGAGTAVAIDAVVAARGGDARAAPGAGPVRRAVVSSHKARALDEDAAVQVSSGGAPGDRAAGAELDAHAGVGGHRAHADGAARASEYPDARVEVDRAVGKRAVRGGPQSRVVVVRGAPGDGATRPGKNAVTVQGRGAAVDAASRSSPNPSDGVAVGADIGHGAVDGRQGAKVNPAAAPLAHRSVAHRDARQTRHRC